MQGSGKADWQEVFSDGTGLPAQAGTREEVGNEKMVPMVKTWLMLVSHQVDFRLMTSRDKSHCDFRYRHKFAFLKPILSASELAQSNLFRMFAPRKQIRHVTEI